MGTRRVVMSDAVRLVVPEGMVTLDCPTRRLRLLAAFIIATPMLPMMGERDSSVAFWALALTGSLSASR